MRRFWAYIVASRSGVLYVGMTNDLNRRIFEHRNKLIPGFASKYNVNILLWYEEFPEAIQAIAAEKKIKGWNRAKKEALISEMNPTWQDLYPNLAESEPTPSRDSSLRSE